MVKVVYERLARHLDNLPAGFPRTESGVELRILHQLFTPEDARLTLHLTLIREEPHVIAYRAKIPVEEAARRLDEMDKKGLIFSIHLKGKPPKYMVQQFIVGFWEAQLNNLSPELVHDFEEYLPLFIDFDFWQKAPQLRTIPVNKSISIQNEVMSYERAEELVRAQTKFSVSNCICRTEQRIMGKDCGHLMETCLSFGMAAERAIRIGRNRAISMEEALAILCSAEEDGLVLQPGNAKNALFICACCGCCCGVLRNLKHDPKPASRVSSPFISHLDTDTCVGCNICAERCQMGAVFIDKGKAVLDVNQCIGCGLCVSTCPTESMSLVRKPKKEQNSVPRNIVQTNIKMIKARGKMHKLIGMLIKSKWSLLLASREK